MPIGIQHWQQDEHRDKDLNEAKAIHQPGQVSQARRNDLPGQTTINININGNNCGQADADPQAEPANSIMGPVK